MKRLKRKFKPAMIGLKEAYFDHSIKLQMQLGLVAIVVGFLLQLTLYEWMIVIVCIGSVVASEIFNTCIERLCDLYTTEQNEEIRKIKDLAASGVLVVSLMSLIVSILIFILHITN